MTTTSSTFDPDNDPFGPPSPCTSVGMRNGRRHRLCSIHGDYIGDECVPCRTARFDAVELVDATQLARILRIDTWHPIYQSRLNFKLSRGDAVKVTTEGKPQGDNLFLVTQVDKATYRVTRVTP